MVKAARPEDHHTDETQRRKEFESERGCVRSTSRSMSERSADFKVYEYLSQSSRAARIYPVFFLPPRRRSGERREERCHPNYSRTGRLLSPALSSIRCRRGSLDCGLAALRCIAELHPANRGSTRVLADYQSAIQQNAILRYSDSKSKSSASVPHKPHPRCPQTATTRALLPA